MQPILYSFRRCPYAMRARLALAISEQSVRLREIVLKHKPADLLAISPNKTIPVLQLTQQVTPDTVLDESLEIMVWALSENDPAQWLSPSIEEMLDLIDINDYEFKPWLDRYKYADRHPEHSVDYYRQQAEEFIFLLESRLNENPYLFSDRISLADMAIFPFIRQFASVDKSWFEQAGYQQVKRWLETLMNSNLFAQCMKKYPTWLESGEEIIFP
ncbi:glutathione S-transferase [Psychromonas sp. 14N.309.X.WAT.B.A12]|uniref:glutathione S-transferase n=1 Tax=Psychromonas sp. 14N.309.X.WAT.B.A12 TaxID=2998322 RepID=UPI0025B18B6D|nr:glutathione S-transferase [Psychromonas sp. 14N.309.X.WAT.B.A12]MDN2662408.1 glutathione S-transferase [Psychromonas sp. 14N.309.X.WAT.B.A12]